MPRNISISSGSDFSKKKFGTITKLTKPAFVYTGRVLSDNTFQNQTTIPLLENNIYYSNHGLKDENVLIDYSISVNFNDNVIQQFIEEYKIFSITSDQSTRAIQSLLTSLQSSSVSLSSLGPGSGQTKDPYDNNPPPECPVP